MIPTWQNLCVVRPRVQVNNAGMLDAEAWARDVFDRTMHTNFFGPVALTRQLLPHLAEGALVIMVSSGTRVVSLGKWGWLREPPPRSPISCAHCMPAPWASCLT